jgi:hypothetical protein
MSPTDFTAFAAEKIFFEACIDLKELAIQPFH